MALCYSTLGNQYILYVPITLNILTFQSFAHTVLSSECFLYLPPTPLLCLANLRLGFRISFCIKPSLRFHFASGSWQHGPSLSDCKLCNYQSQYTMKFLTAEITFYSFLYSHCQVIVRMHCLLSNEILIYLIKGT